MSVRKYSLDEIKRSVEGRGVEEYSTPWGGMVLEDELGRVLKKQLRDDVAYHMYDGDYQHTWLGSSDLWDGAYTIKYQGERVFVARYRRGDFHMYMRLGVVEDREYETVLLNKL